MSALDHPPAGAMWEAPHPLEKVNAELRAELAAAREELAALRRDALRYRFVRRTDAWKGHDLKRPGSIGPVFVANANGYGDALDTDRLDAAIDAALQESRDHD